MNVGDTVTNFTATDQDGTQHSLEELVADGPLVLFFYPKAMSPLCTKESCHFRDLKTDFSDFNTKIVGISADDPSSQKNFDQKHSLGFPLLSDKDGTIAKQFGAKRMGPLPPRRITFVINQDKIVIGAYKNETKANEHADQALELVKGLLDANG